MRKLSNITESVWNDIRRRGIGTDVKKEDDINLLDGEDFCKYLKSKYDIDNSHNKLKSELFCVKTPSICFISIPLFIYNDKKDFENHASFEYYPDEISIGFGCTDKKYCKLFLNLLGERFAGPGSEISLDMNIQYFKGNITNKTLIEMIDFVIDNIKEPLIPLIVKK